MLAGGIPLTASVNHKHNPNRILLSGGSTICRENTHAKAENTDSFKHVLIAFWFPYYPVNTCQHECMCLRVCVCVFSKEIYTQRAARAAARHETVCKGACILSLCGLCCSDKFRVCPDFLESLIPKTPPGDSKHPVHTERAVTMTTRTWTQEHNKQHPWPNLHHTG